MLIDIKNAHEKKDSAKVGHPGKALSVARTNMAAPGSPNLLETRTKSLLLLEKSAEQRDEINKVPIPTTAINKGLSLKNKAQQPIAIIPEIVKKVIA